MPRRQHPLIGLTTYGRNADNRFHLPAEYIEAVRRAGGVPLLVAPGESRLDSLFGTLDALVLTGGGDLDPGHYGGRRHDTNYGFDPERDAAELAIARAALDSTLPTLGICRGEQILNVAAGGTLIEHLPDEVGESVLHRAPPRDPVAHDISITPGSKLAEVLRSTACSIASWHHQAVRQVAEGFVVVARAADGTIEAIERPAHRWLVAVQWHPELTAASDPVQQRLFDALVAEAARH